MTSIYDRPSGKEQALAKIASRTDRSGNCWLWTGSTSAGYGKFKIGRAQVYAHRASYEAHVGPIPEGLFVLHSCDTPACVNPSHLRVGSHVENMRDRDERGRNGHARKTHCPQGHAYDTSNTVLDKRGRRNCLTCKRASARRYARKAGAR